MPRPQDADPQRPSSRLSGVEDAEKYLLAALQASDSPPRRAASLEGLVTIYVRQSRLSEAASYAGQLVRLGESLRGTKDRNVATGYRGTVHFATSDPVPAVVLPADYTFAAADGGTHQFSVTLWTPPSQTVSATDTVNASLTQSQSVDISLVSSRPAVRKRLVVLHRLKRRRRRLTTMEQRPETARRAGAFLLA